MPTLVSWPIRGVVVPFFSTASKTQVKYIVDETSMSLMFVGNKEQLESAVWLMNNNSTLRKVVSFDETAIDGKDERLMGWSDFLAHGKQASATTDLEKILTQAEPDDLATIIYTSGTTGEPKGVMLGQDNFISCLQIHDQRLDVNEKDVSMCFLPLSHIFERAWSFYMIHCGATLVFLENPKSVIEELPLAKPTLMCTVPRFFEKTYEGIRAEEAKWSPVKRKIFDWTIKVGYERSEYLKNSLPIPMGLQIKYNLANKVTLQKLRSIFGGSIRTMPCSGAAIRTELLRFFHATGIFVNYGYGASETTATVSCFRTDHYEFGSCGTIMPDVEVKMDEKGEILVKAATVFKGYYNKPNETAKVLTDGWYHTGDKGSFSSLGNLVMEDRLNDIFKTSGGKYVSPQKIELLLSNDPFIEQAIVIGDNRENISQH
ncbi:MAG: AMP-binding protein [Bacteroidales bacterium]|nr:AMP-binding protein [Bacteroidales bacterium]